MLYAVFIDWVCCVKRMHVELSFAINAACVSVTPLHMLIPLFEGIDTKFYEQKLKMRLYCILLLSWYALFML